MPEIDVDTNNNEIEIAVNAVGNSVANIETSPLYGPKGDKGDKGDTGSQGPQGEQGPKGDDGYSPTASVEETETGATITITDINGTTTASVLNGVDGQDGSDGADGADGFSPIATVSKSGTVTTLSVTDVNGTTTATINDGVDGQNGTDGQDGYSPTATVSKSNDTATITITDKNGTTTATVSDGTNGQDGQDGQDGFSPIATVSKTGSVATITITDKNGTTIAQVSDGAGSITDVQQNGVSVVSGGVANVIVPDAQVQSDWNETSATSKAYILNKPTIPDTSSMANVDLSNLSATGETHFVKSDIAVTHTKNTTVGSTSKPVYVSYTGVATVCTGLSISNLCNTSSSNITSNTDKPCVVQQHYVNGTSWYRVWSDGWIEQGGALHKTAGITTDAVVTVTFLKAFTGTNYSLVSNVGSNSSTNISQYRQIYANTQTGFTYRGKSDYMGNWYACGY